MFEQPSKNESRRNPTPNYERMIEISQERDIDGEVINAEISWLRFKKPEGADSHDLADTIEGKLYTPPTEKQNGELIVFTPGFPGGNAGRFEQRYARSFVDEGYAFLAIRHNGTALDRPETANEIINSPDRINLAENLGERHIGGTKEEGYRLTDIVKETVVPLLALRGEFSRIHLMGQSMGVASSYYALNRLKDDDEIIGKIGNVVGIAGYVGGDSGEEDIWDGMKMPAQDLIDYERSYIEKVGTNAVITMDDMRSIAKWNDDNEVPEHVGNILVFTPGDPLIAGPENSGKDFVRDYGPRTNRKLVISDETNLDAPKQHSMLWIDPKNLLRAVQATVSKYGPHYVVLPNTSEGEHREGLVKQG